MAQLNRLGRTHKGVNFVCSFQSQIRYFTHTHTHTSLWDLVGCYYKTCACQPEPKKAPWWVLILQLEWLWEELENEERVCPRFPPALFRATAFAQTSLALHTPSSGLNLCFPSFRYIIEPARLPANFECNHLSRLFSRLCSHSGRHRTPISGHVLIPRKSCFLTRLYPRQRQTQSDRRICFWEMGSAATQDGL